MPFQAAPSKLSLKRIICFLWNKKLLGAPGLTTRSKKLGAPGRTTRNKDATSNKKLLLLLPAVFASTFAGLRLRPVQERLGGPRSHDGHEWLPAGRREESGDVG